MPLNFIAEQRELPGEPSILAEQRKLPGEIPITNLKNLTASADSATTSLDTQSS